MNHRHVETVLAFQWQGGRAVRAGRTLRHAAGRFLRALVARLEDPAAIRRNTFITGKFSPLQGTAPHLVVPHSPGWSADGAIQVPPKDLWEGYGETAEDYLRSGEEDVAGMVKILYSAGLQIDDMSRVLDFGCAAGRMLRHFPARRPAAELWGVDIKARPITWCQQHFAPPFRFATMTTSPHLPFEDNYFDLIYSGSVFTHIADLADAWLLELKRILRSGGLMYVTVHDGHTIELLRGRYRNRSGYRFLNGMIKRLDAETSFLSTRYACFFIGQEPAVQVFYDIEYLTEKWSRFLNIVSVTEEAYGYQTALVLRK